MTDRMASVSLSLFSRVFSFTIPSLVSICAWFTSLPSCPLLLYCCGEPSRLQKLLKPGSEDVSVSTSLFFLSPVLALEQNWVSFVFFLMNRFNVSWLLYWTEDAVRETLSTETRDQHWHLLNYVPLTSYTLQWGGHCGFAPALILCCVTWSANESRTLKGHNLNTFPFLLFRGMGIAFKTIKMRFTSSFG